MELVALRCRGRFSQAEQDGVMLECQAFHVSKCRKQKYKPVMFLEPATYRGRLRRR